jgi:membrane protein implicated in regulation of membrane protease activity
MPIHLGMTGFWLIIMVVMLAVEAAAPGLVSVWFSVGALAALISALCKAAIWLQVVIFVGVSVLALVITKPLVKKFVNGKAQPTNADMILGKECIVREAIDNLAGTGAVSAGGKIWTARSTEDAVKIPEGAYVSVVRIEGVKAIVKVISSKEDSL